MSLQEDEYRALRDTIRERGTARVWAVVAGIFAWAALTAATAALSSTPVGTLLPLVMLIATFEAVYALHVGVERIGRYLQVFYEAADDRTPRWESAAMAFGRPANAARVDPLFAIVFAIAALFNLAPAALLPADRARMDLRRWRPCPLRASNHRRPANGGEAAAHRSRALSGIEERRRESA